MDAATLQDLFDSFANLRILVVGDVMLDNYWWGEVERISPEAPVPVVRLKRRESRLGGAANVALNLRSLGAQVEMATVIGADSEGQTLKRLLDASGIGTALVQPSTHRPTTTKARVMGHTQQMLRIDEEITDDLNTEEEHPFIDAVMRYLQREKPQMVIFEDYNKGVLKENVIDRLLGHCQLLHIPTAVDPKKKNFLAYKGVTIFKPNLKEVREGLHLPIDQVTAESLQAVHQALAEVLQHQITFLTLSEKGVYAQDDTTAVQIPSHLRHIADVSGAGDTVIATAALTYAATQDMALMAALSNLAGGLVCEEVGVVPINKNRLLEEAIRVLGEA
ncbi:MAG: carbohydrate kinase [Sphingobacteriales bacterium]|nr:MAG: carbohydrate kinase [Sphingobacteriales bacterium]